MSDGIVSLRAWRESDASALAAAWCDPSIYRWTLIPEDLGAEDARRWIAASTDPAVRSISLQLAAVNARSGQLLGSVGLADLDWEHSVAEIFYWTAAAARGHGVATRAVRLLSDWAFRQLGIVRLGLFTHVDNPASQRVAERCGYIREGVLRSCRVVKGERVDLVLFSLLSVDVQPRME